MGILPSCSCVSTTEWLHHWDLNKMSKEKARWKQHENVVCCFEQIMRIAAYKIAVVWQLTSNRTNHPSKINKTDREVRKNSWVTFSYGLLHMDTSVLADQQKITNTGCHVKDLPRTMVGMNDKRDSRESVLSACLDYDDIDTYIKGVCQYQLNSSGYF